jgi:hypothetical protein
MVFYGYLYRTRANLARPINNKSLYELLWLYGIYAALDRFPQNEQVLLMTRYQSRQTPVNISTTHLCFGILQTWNYICNSHIFMAIFNIC